MLHTKEDWQEELIKEDRLKEKINNKPIDQKKKQDKKKDESKQVRSFFTLGFHEHCPEPYHLHSPTTGLY